MAPMYKKKVVAPLTEEELDAVTVVFHQFETGLREGTIYTKDLLSAMKSLGLSPTEQEVVDMQNEVEKKGRIFFPDFCKLCLRKFREFDDEDFRQELFKNLCGTEPHPVRFRAKKYKIQEKSFSLADFKQMMNHLPEPVDDQEIMEMFDYADKDRDGRINFEEFLVMITPIKVPDAPIIYAKPKQPNKNKKNTNLANGTMEDKKDPASLSSKTHGLAHEDKAKPKNGKDSQKISLPTSTNAELVSTAHANSDHDNHDSGDNVPITNTGTIEGENLNVVLNTTVGDTTNNPMKTTIPTTTICTTTATRSANNIPVATLVTTA